MTTLPGHLYILIGPAGSGKNTLMNRAFEAIPSLRQLATATTRPIRSTEQEGREHYFLTEDEFKKLIEQNALLEHQNIHQRWYGIIREKLENELQKGTHMLADIEVLGAKAVREAFPENVTAIYIQPPNVCKLIDRMTARAEQFSGITHRLLRVELEAAYAPECNYILINDHIDEASAQFIDIIHSTQNHQPINIPRPEPMKVAYQVEIAVTDGTKLLVGADDTPHIQVTYSPTQNPLLPHQYAQEIFHQHFPNSDGTWLFGGDAEREFMPPSHISCKTSDGVDVITYQYVIHLNHLPSALEGYQWGEIVNDSQTHTFLSRNLKSN